MARVAAYDAEVAGAFEGWQRERAHRWDAVRGHVSTLTLQLRVAVVELRRKVDAVRSSRRESVRDALRWTARFDAERQRLEHEIWSQLQGARRDDERWRKVIQAKAAELEALGRRLAGELDGAFLEAQTTASDTRVADLPAGRALAHHLGRAREDMARRVAAAGASIEAELGRLAGRAAPDVGEILRRFDGAMIERLGGARGVAAAARPLARVARAPAGPPRKKARVPRFLLNKFYREGGVRRGGEGVEITFTNPLAFCIVQGGDAVVVDGRPHPKGDTVLDNGERRVSGLELSGSAYLKFPKGGEIKVTLRGLALPPGPHRFNCNLELRKMGWVELHVTDRM
jgi:hypothetical protein